MLTMAYIRFPSPYILLYLIPQLPQKVNTIFQLFHRCRQVQNILIQPVNGRVRCKSGSVWGRNCSMLENIFTAFITDPDCADNSLHSGDQLNLVSWHQSLKEDGFVTVAKNQKLIILYIFCSGTLHSVLRPFLGVDWVIVSPQTSTRKRTAPLGSRSVTRRTHVHLLNITHLLEPIQPQRLPGHAATALEWE